MDNDKIYLNQNKSKGKDDLYLDSYNGHDWGEKLSFTVGVSYIVGIFFLFLTISKLNRIFRCG